MSGGWRSYNTKSIYKYNTGKDGQDNGSVTERFNAQYKSKLRPGPKSIKYFASPSLPGGGLRKEMNMKTKDNMKIIFYKLQLFFAKLTPKTEKSPNGNK